MESDIKYILYQKHADKIEAASIALKNKLYAGKDWEMYSWLNTAKFLPIEVRAIVLAFKNDMPVAVLFVWKDSIAGLFVKKEERRRGIGTKLVETFCQTGYVPAFTPHDPRSQEFFEGLDFNIELRDEYWISEENEDC